MTWASATTGGGDDHTRRVWRRAWRRARRTISATLGSGDGLDGADGDGGALQSIAVTPANPIIAKGLTQQFTATGTFSDNTTQNLTSQVTWASATPAVATITAAGLATGVAAGTTHDQRDAGSGDAARRC